MSTGVTEEIRDFKSGISFLKREEGLADSLIEVEVQLCASCEVVVQIGITKNL